MTVFPSLFFLLLSSLTRRALSAECLEIDNFKLIEDVIPSIETISVSTHTDEQACSAFCRMFSECQAFSFVDGDGTGTDTNCLLYDTTGFTEFETVPDLNACTYFVPLPGSSDVCKPRPSDCSYPEGSDAYHHVGFPVSLNKLHSGFLSKDEFSLAVNVPTVYDRSRTCFTLNAYDPSVVANYQTNGCEFWGTAIDDEDQCIITLQNTWMWSDFWNVIGSLTKMSDHCEDTFFGVLNVHTVEPYCVEFPPGIFDNVDRVMNWVLKYYVRFHSCVDSQNTIITNAEPEMIAVIVDQTVFVDMNEDRWIATEDFQTITQYPFKVNDSTTADCTFLDETGGEISGVDFSLSLVEDCEDQENQICYQKWQFEFSQFDSDNSDNSSSSICQLNGRCSVLSEFEFQPSSPAGSDETADYSDFLQDELEIELFIETETFCPELVDDVIAPTASLTGYKDESFTEEQLVFIQNRRVYLSFDIDINDKVSADNIEITTVEGSLGSSLTEIYVNNGGVGLAVVANCDFTIEEANGEGIRFSFILDDICFDYLFDESHEFPHYEELTVFVEALVYWRGNQEVRLLASNVFSEQLRATKTLIVQEAQPLQEPIDGDETLKETQPETQTQSEVVGKHFGIPRIALSWIIIATVLICVIIGIVAYAKCKRGAHYNVITTLVD